MKLSIVLPCYNEAENLPLILEGYRASWRPDLEAELVLVDNGSTDTTQEVLAQALGQADLAFARSIRVPVNVGYGHGIATGLRAARGEFLAFSHADMQCSPADVFRAYDVLCREPDPLRALVKGRRAWRGLGPAIFTTGMGVASSAILGRKLGDINGQPKVFHRSFFEGPASNPPDQMHMFDLYMLYRARRAGLRVVEIPVVFGERAHGESKWALNLGSRWRSIKSTIGYAWRLRIEP